ncbi:hypothetical protein MNBD_DELTA02-23 [hydrothermal vent metagenome]|uniref:PD-(D/E)XK endonuclease-like domain-containing protein n=1 Tax=hydrothermal vent metagenome TaxID=652676 RepID=A0A3B0V2G1_9ZZZZ
MVSERLDRIIKAAEGGAAVVTVNKRLARYLSVRCEAAMAASGRAAWPTSVVMPLTAWLRGLMEDSWQEGRAALITEAGAASLWKKIIEEDKVIAGRKVLVGAGGWQAAASAYALMKEYCVKGLGDEIYLGAEALAFKRWSREYDKALKRLGFMDYSELPGAVSKAVESGRAVLPGRVVFAGFDELTPQRAAFIRALRQAGTEVEHWPSEPRSAPEEERFLLEKVKDRVELCVFGDIKEEVRAAARWIREVSASEKGGRVRLGVIVPELAGYRDIILREFRAELSPASALAWEDIQDVFNISLGSSLSEEPLVRGALDILAIGGWPEDIAKMGSALLSPLLRVNEEEGLALAALDAGFKRRKLLKVGLRDIRQELTAGGDEVLKAFAGRIGRWIEYLEGAGERALPVLWGERFSALLGGLGWQHGGESLSSREYQTLEAWRSLLAEFAALGDIVGPISRQDAVARLRAMAAEKVFQVEGVSDDCGAVAEGSGTVSDGLTAKEVSIEVLGMLEASGQDFDHIWLMGAHDGALPGPAAPNPFIPIELQRRFGMPRATPEKMLGFAALLLKRIFESARNFVVSYPLEIEGKVLALSPLLKGVGRAEEWPLSLTAATLSRAGRCSSSLKADTHAAFALEDMPLDGKIPLSKLEAAGLRGGTSVIKDQSECPFRAFARHRLGARTVELPEEGLDSAERGTIVHEALEFFWREAGNSARLRELKDRGELGAAVAAAAGRALKGYYAKRLPRRLIDMEGERVEALVAEWLEIELKRGPFTVVRTEFGEKVTVGGLSIAARPDRLDELEGGARVIIDYKTGACDKNGWLPDKLTEPQMLLYGIGSGFDAIAFASLKLPGTKFVGISKDDGMLPAVKSLNKETRWREKIEGVEDWDDLMERWREALTRVAEDFVAGSSGVSPSSPDACKYCELPVLCRIFEAGGLKLDGPEARR